MARAGRSSIAGGVLLAAIAAVAFGLTTPIIALRGAGTGPLTIAALLYAGAALAALAVRPMTPGLGRRLTLQALPRLLAVAFFGGALAPTLFAWGVLRAGAMGSALMLNFEALFTVALARAIYREPSGRHFAAGVLTMFAGGILVSFDSASEAGSVELWGLCAVLAATACWAIDNALTKRLAEEHPLEVVAGKGALGALLTCGLALLLGEPRSDLSVSLALLACGATGYGMSLCLYLLAQRRVGAARTGSVFALAPFIGAALGWLLGADTAGVSTVLGALAFAAGVVLHTTERHAHRHVHEPIEHEHAHRHDDGHHDHQHDPPVSGEHTHAHRHDRVEHAHEHAPDIHHDHEH